MTSGRTDADVGDREIDKVGEKLGNSFEDTDAAAAAALLSSSLLRLAYKVPKGWEVVVTTEGEIFWTI